MNTTEAGTGTGSDQVDSELVCRLAIQLEDADACFPAFKGCQGGMKAYKEVYANQEDIDTDLSQAFSKDLDSCGLSSSKQLQRYTFKELLDKHENETNKNSSHIF